MALYAFDGTWNTAKDGDDPQYQNTNVVRFQQAYSKRSGTNDLYEAGIGTRFDLVGRIIGGLFGAGELPRINEAYDHLCANWMAGDTVIDIVGFSRGAATTLDFCHKVHKDGIRKPGTNQVVEPQPVIRFLGVWDVVAAFGLANIGNTALNIGHHLYLPKANLQYAFHAMALDERRTSFLPTRLQGACEVWFRGVHSDVGGGNGNRGLNDLSLRWMMRKARAAGLPIDETDIAGLQPDPAAKPHIDEKLKINLRVVGSVDRSHYSVSAVQGCSNPPESCHIETMDDEGTAIVLGSQGLEVLPPADRARVEALWSTAEATARQLEFPLDACKDAFVTLLQYRVSLIKTESDLQKGRDAVARLVTAMVRAARQRGFHVMNEYFLTETLFLMPRQFPLTD